MKALARGWVQGAWVLASVLALGMIGLLYPVRNAFTSGSPERVVIGAIGMMAYASVGAVIAARARNVIGWIFLTVALSYLLGGFADLYSLKVLVMSPGSLPGGRIAVWVQSWSIYLFASIPLLPLLFPTGQLPNRRWRPVLWAGLAGVGLGILGSLLIPGPMLGQVYDHGLRIANPTGISGAGGLALALRNTGVGLALLTAVCSIVSLVLRYRRAQGEERQQIRWLAYVAAVVLSLLLIELFSPRDSTVGDKAFIVMFFTIIFGVPAACTVAILRYRLYDLDFVIRKTVVFGLLAVFITVVYAGVVGGIGVLVDSKSNTLLSFVAAALLAIAFQPARDRARRIADRIVYGKRATPYEVLAEFSERMSETYASEDVLPRMAGILRAGTGASTATVWLRVGRELRPATSTREAERPPLTIAGDALPAFPAGEHAVAVRHQGELLGALSVVMPPADPMNPAKDKLVRDLASQAGLVLRNVRLIEELRASRQRLVAAQDEERRKIERNLHDGAQQQLVALQVKLKLAEQLVDRDLEQASGAIHGLQRDAASVLEDLRDLARGIYPPLLADQGLAAALEAQARRAAVPIEVRADGGERYSQDVESAIYFCVLECLQNVAKYAEASNAAVSLEQKDGHLTFTVNDDGKGFDPAATGYGTGLQGIADRLDAIGGTLAVKSSPGGGTMVTGQVPAPASELA